jgi:hypothetical protein
MGKRYLRLFIGALLVLSGGTWFFQGLGVIRGDSFMVDNPAWIVIGLITALAGAAILAWPRLRGSRQEP